MTAAEAFSGIGVSSFDNHQMIGGKSEHSGIQGGQGAFVSETGGSLVGHQSARSQNGLTYGIYSAGTSD